MDEDECVTMQADEETGPSWIRTSNQGIMSHSRQRDSRGKNRGDSESSPALPVYFPSDPELLRLIDAWPALPAPLRAGILAMIDSVKG
jgi:hypothetical protein